MNAIETLKKKYILHCSALCSQNTIRWTLFWRNNFIFRHKPYFFNFCKSATNFLMLKKKKKILSKFQIVKSNTNSYVNKLIYRHSIKTMPYLHIIFEVNFSIANLVFLTKIVAYLAQNTPSERFSSNCKHLI